MRSQWQRCLITAFISLLLGGCFGVRTLPVHGKVTLADGTPVKGATVVFEDAEKHVSASGVTSAEGAFQLTSVKPNDGAPAGNYKVTVHEPSATDSSQAQPPRTFAARYENPDTSGLEFTVASDRYEFDIVLEKPAARATSR